MCPPPADPIRPIGPVAGGTWVDRARLAERMHRRRPRDGEEQHDEQPRRRQAGEGGPGRPDAGSESTPSAVVDPRAYDDHGRRREAADEPDVPHVDASA